MDEQAPNVVCNSPGRIWDTASIRVPVSLQLGWRARQMRGNERSLSTFDFVTLNVAGKVYSPPPSFLGTTASASLRFPMNNIPCSVSRTVAIQTAHHACEHPKLDSIQKILLCIICRRSFHHDTAQRDARTDQETHTPRPLSS